MALIPSEVLSPALAPRMKQYHVLTVIRVKRRLPRSLKLVSAVTGEAEVLDCSQAACDDRNNMLDDHRAAAVCATMLVEQHHLTAERNGNLRALRHGSLLSRDRVTTPLE